jgi:hypothetical protein
MSVHWRIVNQLKSKVERAEQHIRDLEAVWRTHKKRAYPVTRKKDAKAREYIYTLRDVKPVPVNVPWLVGDAVHNLRSALDHVAYHLAVVATSGTGPFDGLYFPIGKDRTSFKSKLRQAKKYKTAAGGTVKRLRQDAIDAIKLIEPYEGGKGELLSYIHQLDVIDKHHSLLAIGAANVSHSMPPSQVRRYKEALGISADDRELTPKITSRAFLTNSGQVPIYPLEAGQELRRVPFEEFDKNMYFTFEVAFGEPQVIKGKPLIPTLYRASKLIRDIIRDFENGGLLR